MFRPDRLQSRPGLHLNPRQLRAGPMPEARVTVRYPVMQTRAGRAEEVEAAAAGAEGAGVGAGGHPRTVTICDTRRSTLSACVISPALTKVRSRAS